MENQANPQQQGADIQSAANAMIGILDAPAKAPPEPKKAKEVKEVNENVKSVAEQEHDVNEAPVEDTGETDSNIDESEASDNKSAEGEDKIIADAEKTTELPESIEQLAEAMGVTTDKLLSMKMPTNVDGVKGHTTLGELVKSYQIDKVTTQKSMQLAEERKAFQAELDAQVNELTQRYSIADNIINVMADGLKKHYESTNWDELRLNDPSEWAAKQTEFQQQYQAVQQMQQQLYSAAQQHAQQVQQKQAQQVKEFYNQQYQLMGKEFPEWNDPEKQQVFRKQTRSFLEESGFHNDEIKQVVDVRIIKLIDKARKYDNLMKSKNLVDKKIASVPKFVKPGASKSKAELQAENRRAQMTALKKSGGSTKAAAALIQGFL